MDNTQLAISNLKIINRQINDVLASLQRDDQWRIARCVQHTTSLYGVYKHYKTGKYYEVLLISNGGGTLKPLVHYVRYDNADAQVWTRTIENFCSHVPPKNPFTRMWKWWQRQLGIAAGDLPKRFVLVPNLPRRRIIERPFAYLREEEERDDSNDHVNVA